MIQSLNKKPSGEQQTVAPVLEFDEVWFAYDGQLALQDITFAVTKGEFMAVLGPNGSGKTTLLKLARTDLPPLFPPVSEPALLAREYTIKRGDTLSRLAGKFYGDVSPASWKRIYAANKEVIGPNPSRLHIGMRLRIPQP